MAIGAKPMKQFESDRSPGGFVNQEQQRNNNETTTKQQKI